MQEMQEQKIISQIDFLANYIMAEVDGEPSRSEGAGSTAVRLLKRYRYALDRIIHELGVPQPGSVANAYEIASDALSGKERFWSIDRVTSLGGQTLHEPDAANVAPVETGL